MANLSGIEKFKLEKLLEMGGGYVLDFSNRSFQEFVFDSIGRDIDDVKYNYASSSKANRLRAFWKIESNNIVGKLIIDLLEYWKTKKIIDGGISPADNVIYEDCMIIGDRLKQDSIVENIDVIKANVDDKDFELLAKSIRESIEKNEPEAALDRLHTFTVRYVRDLCEKHAIQYDKSIPLHGLFGSYIKYLRQHNLIESEMAEHILKSSIAVLEKFNVVRNNQSFAHDNPILNYHESVLIFNNISNVIRFVESIESRQKATEEKQKEDDIWSDIPF